MLPFRTKQAEAQAKQEIEKKKKEERERKKREEKEKRKREEEEKQKAEEEKKLLEKQRKQMEKQLKMEEVKKKKEEEKKKKDEEKMRKEAVACRMREEEARRQDERRKEEDARLEEQQETEQVPHKGVYDGEQQNKHDKIEQEGHKLEAGGEEKHGVLPRNEEDEAERLKNNEEGKTTKQNKEPLVPSDGEVQKLEETVNKKGQGLRRENDNENKNEEKLSEGDELDKIQMNDRNSEVEGEMNVDRKQSSKTEQVFEQSPKVAQDFEQPPEVVQDFGQSAHTTMKMEPSPKSVLEIEQSAKTVLEIEQSSKTVQDLEQPAKTVQDFEQTQSSNTAPEMDQGNIETNIICDDSNTKVSSRDSNKLDSSCTLGASRDWGAYLPDYIDNQRLTWIRDCLSWR